MCLAGIVHLLCRLGAQLQDAVDHLVVRLRVIGELVVAEIAVHALEHLQHLIPIAIAALAGAACTVGGILIVIADFVAIDIFGRFVQYALLPVIEQYLAGGNGSRGNGRGNRIEIIGNVTVVIPIDGHVIGIVGIDIACGSRFRDVHDRRLLVAVDAPVMHVRIEIVGCDTWVLRVGRLIGYLVGFLGVVIEHGSEIDFVFLVAQIDNRDEPIDRLLVLLLAALLRHVL